MIRAHAGKWPFTFAAAALAVTGMARPASAAITLSSLSNPTVQTLIDLGSDGATAGDARYFNFSYFGSVTAPAANAVKVQAIGTADDGGLRFISSWIAGSGSAISSTISYDVASLDGNPINGVNLLSNGTAPLAAAQTFATATMSTTTQGGSSIAPILSTFDDGRTSPTDTTAADVDSSTTALHLPQSPVSVTDALTVFANNGGVATASFVQNGFTFATSTPAAVPEPTYGLGLVAVGLGWAGRRRFRAK